MARTKGSAESQEEEGTRAVADIRLPWMRQSRGKGLHRAPRRVADALSEPVRTKADEKLREFIIHAHDGISIAWRPEWDGVLALGPFSGRRYLPSSLPVICLTRGGSPYEQLSALSEALAGPFANTGVLPDLFLLPSDYALQLHELQNADWLATEGDSVLLGDRQR